MRTKIEYHSKSDEKGCCSFTLTWMAHYHPGDRDGEHGWRKRGQCFRADPRKYGHPRPEDVPAWEHDKERIARLVVRRTWLRFDREGLHDVAWTVRANADIHKLAIHSELMRVDPAKLRKQPPRLIVAELANLLAQAVLAIEIKRLATPDN